MTDEPKVMMKVVARGLMLVKQKDLQRVDRKECSWVSLSVKK